MKKITLITLTLALIGLGVGKFQLISEVLAGASVQAGAPAPPQPPESNPHPPQSKQDIERVKFAEEAVKILLMQNLPTKLQMSDVDKTPSFESKTLSCFKNVTCYSKDTAFVNEILTFQKQNGKVIEIKHAHIIPWSMKRMNIRSSAPDQPPGKNETMKPMAFDMSAPDLKSDEFMVHIYAKFDKSQRWYHLDVILTEDKNGNLLLRHFYAIPMPLSSQQMPPGVVC